MSFDAGAIVPSTIDRLLEKGQKLVSDNNLPQALVLANKCVEQDGKHPEVWSFLGEVKFKWGDTEDAVAAYKKAIDLRPDYAPYYYHLGRAYFVLERYNDALLQYEHAVHIDPTNDEYLAAKGILYCQAPPDMDLLDKGIEMLEQCSQRAPDNDDVRNSLAVAYIAKAHEDWVLDPEEDDARYATRIEHIEKAKPYINKAVELKITDKALAGMIVKGKEAVRDAEKRKFVGRYRPGILTIFISAIALTFGGFSILWFLYLIFGVLYFFALRRPGYVTNRKSFEGGDKPSVLDRIMAPIYDVAGGITFYGSFLSNLRRMFLLRGVIDLIRDALSVLFLPIETIKGLLENYDLKGLISKK